jgi:hypothetical protein
MKGYGKLRKQVAPDSSSGEEPEMQSSKFGQVQQSREAASGQEREEDSDVSESDSGESEQSEEVRLVKQQVFSSFQVSGGLNRLLLSKKSQQLFRCLRYLAWHSNFDTTWGRLCGKFQLLGSFWEVS